MTSNRSGGSGLINAPEFLRSEGALARTREELGISQMVKVVVVAGERAQRERWR